MTRTLKTRDKRINLFLFSHQQLVLDEVKEISGIHKQQFIIMAIKEKLMRDYPGISKTF